MSSATTFEEEESAELDAGGAAARWLDQSRESLVAAAGVGTGTLLGDAVREIVAAMTLAVRADAVELVGALGSSSEELVRTHEGRSLRAWIGEVRALVMVSAPPGARPLLLALVAELERSVVAGAPPERSHLREGSPRHAVASAYLAALLRADRRTASALVHEALSAGVPLRELYTEVFAPVQREVGRLWQRGEITIADEHFCTAATQLVMSQLYDRLFAGSRRGATLVATSAPGDLHEVGIRIVADFFEMRGWDTVYLGASTPPAAVADAVSRHGASLLAISATLTSHVEGVRGVVGIVRAHVGAVPVLVGGPPFQLAPSLLRYVGADASAATPEEAVRIAETLVAERGLARR